MSASTVPGTLLCKLCYLHLCFFLLWHVQIYSVKKVPLLNPTEIRSIQVFPMKVTLINLLYRVTFSSKCAGRHLIFAGRKSYSWTLCTATEVFPAVWLVLSEQVKQSQEENGGGVSPAQCVQPTQSWGEVNKWNHLCGWTVHVMYAVLRIFSNNLEFSPPIVSSFVSIMTTFHSATLFLRTLRHCPTWQEQTCCEQTFISTPILWKWKWTHVSYNPLLHTEGSL